MARIVTQPSVDNTRRRRKALQKSKRPLTPQSISQNSQEYLSKLKVHHTNAIPTTHISNIQNNLIATPGVYINARTGEPYAGPMHMHDGYPMIGAKHSSESHDALERINDAHTLAKKNRQFTIRNKGKKPSRYSTEEIRRREIRKRFYNFKNRNR